MTTVCTARKVFWEACCHQQASQNVGMCNCLASHRHNQHMYDYIASHSTLTLWRRNFFLNFSTPCIYNVNNTGTKKGSIMK